jgi:hypothetical protein
VPLFPTGSVGFTVRDNEKCFHSKSWVDDLRCTIKKVRRIVEFGSFGRGVGKGLPQVYGRNIDYGTAVLTGHRLRHSCADRPQTTAQLCWQATHYGTAVLTGHRLRHSCADRPQTTAQLCRQATDYGTAVLTGQYLTLARQNRLTSPTKSFIFIPNTLYFPSDMGKNFSNSISIEALLRFAAAQMKNS